MKEVSEKGMHALFRVCACSSILAVFVVCAAIFIKGLPALLEIGPLNFLSGMEWKPSSGLYGIFPMIVASIYVTAGALLVGVPAGIFCAVYLVYYASEKSARILRPAIELLAGIPSIVYGLFGLMVLVPLIQNLFPGTSGKGILCASVLLGIMILPTVVSVSQSSLQAVDPACYEGSLALGASHERSVYLVCLKAAKSGILAAVILAVGRAVGETMAVIMVAGNSAVMPGSILSSVRTLTGNIVLEMSYATGLHQQALFSTAVVLFVFILLINLSFSCIKRKERA